jgi:hypothetical protein
MRWTNKKEISLHIEFTMTYQREWLQPLLEVTISSISLAHAKSLLKSLRRNAKIGMIRAHANMTHAHRHQILCT